jgi:putative phage-type endonuclease
MIEQGSQAWFAARAGHVTASRVEAVLAKGQSGKPSATRANYMAQLIAERLTGVVEEGYKSAAMARGNEVEPEARAAYAFMRNVELAPGGFVLHPTIPMAGASPDSLVGEDGLLEVKAPNTATHLDTLLGASIDGGYMKQMLWQLACTGRKWVDWVSYDNRLPMHLQMHVRRVYRDDVKIAEMETEVKKFLGEIDDKLVALGRLGSSPVAEAA